MASRVNAGVARPVIDQGYPQMVDREARRVPSHDEVRVAVFLEVEGLWELL